MNILNKITKTKITRTENQLTLKVFPMWAILSLYSLVYLGWLAWAIYTWQLFFTGFLLLVVFTYSFSLVRWLIQQIHGYDLIITGNNEQKSIIPKAPSFTNIVLQEPFFIDMFVTTKGSKVKVLVEYHGQKLGLFRLASANDLSEIIDGFMELLNLELVNNYKLSNGELLSFKSKKMAIPPYSALQIMELKDVTRIRSIVKKDQEFEIDFINRQLKNGQQTIDFSAIQRIFIINHKTQNQVVIALKNGQRIAFFKNKTTEITAIRDAERLKTLLENHVELSEITISMVDKNGIK